MTNRPGAVSQYDTEVYRHLVVLIWMTEDANYSQLHMIFEDQKAAIEEAKTMNNIDKKVCNSCRYVVRSGWIDLRNAKKNIIVE